MKNWQALVVAVTLLLIGAVSGAAQTVVPLGDAPAAEPPSLDAEKAAPAAPTRLQALAILTNRVFLLWQDNSNNETSFRVEVSTGGAFTELVPPLGPNNFTATVAPLSPGTTYTFRVRASNGDGNSAYSNEATVTTRTTNACTGSSTEMCLNNNRFRIQALYQTTGTFSGEAHAVELTTDSGYLWFFQETNIEAVVKVLNACSSTNSYWIFAAGLTNVRVALAVVDTQSQSFKIYVNPINTPFPPIQDTQGLSSCP